MKDIILAGFTGEVYSSHDNGFPCDRALKEN